MYEFKRLQYKRNSPVFFEKKALTISGLEYFRIDEIRTVINEKYYFTKDLTIGILKRLIEFIPGASIEIHQGIDHKISALELQSYVSKIIYKTSFTPVDINVELFRQEDVIKEVHCDGQLINDNLFTGKIGSELYLDATTFDLYLLDLKHRGFKI